MNAACKVFGSGDGIHVASAGSELAGMLRYVSGHSELAACMKFTKKTVCGYSRWHNDSKR